MLIFLVTLFIITFLYYLNKTKYNYWARKNIIGPKPFPIFGNYCSVFLRLKSEAEFLKEVYETYDGDFIGIYKGLQPVLLVKNPTVIKQILFKDFDYFNVRCIETLLAKYKHSIYIMNGDENWKRLRRLFAPGMLSDRIEKMIPLIQKSVEKYLKYIENMTEKYTHFEVRSLQNKYTLNVFNKLIFNREYDVFELNNFEEAVTELISSKLAVSYVHIAECIFPSTIASIVANTHDYFNTYNLTFQHFVKNLIQEIENKGVKQNNMLEFLIGMKITGKTRKDKDLSFDIDDDFILQQTMTFFLTAFESTSNVLTFVFYELANNEEVQERCVDEIKNCFDKFGADLTGESISQMKYLQMVIDEAMRKHATQINDRKCLAKYTFSGTSLTIDENVFVYVPVHGLHNDPKYFPNPELFEPGRFSTENKDKIPTCAYLPFGDGPRMCIGQRLATNVMIIGLSSFLNKYKILPGSSKLKYDPRRIRMLAPLGNLWVKIERRK